MMRLLLDGKADTERKSNNGSTVLIKACRIGYLDGVKLLVERGANLNTQCEDGTTCLLVALDYGHPSIVAHLLEQNSCKVKDCGRDGHCLLQRLVLADGPKLILNLKKKRVDLNKRSPVRRQLILAHLSAFRMVLCLCSLQQRIARTTH